MMIKKEKPLPPITDDEKPFEIPKSWKWVRLGEIATVLGGKRIPAGRKLTTVNTGHIYIRVSDMKDDFVSTNNRFSGFASGTSKYDSVTNGYYADSQYIGGLPESPIVRVPQGRGTTMKSFTFRMETSTAHRRLVIDNESSVFLKFNSTTKRMTFDNTQTLERIKELNSYEYENSFLAPTHFTVRSVLDPSAVLARNVPIENALTGFIYTSVLDDVLASDYPLLVEFMKIDIVDGMIDKVFSTNCSRYYAQKVSG